MKNDLVRLGRFISLVLRHSPETINIHMDNNGWVNVEELIRKMKTKGRYIDKETLKEIVETNNKKRYEYNSDMRMIRARQGHSISVDVELTVVKPSLILYHGTASKNIDSIKKEGIKKQQRQHVHLSDDYNTAVNVGKRHGKPYIIKVQALQMYNDGKKFYISNNGVWLTDGIEVKYLVFE